MAHLPLTFPVFYHCAIKNNHKKSQKDAVNLLLTGYPADTPGFGIKDTMVSNYVSGRKPLSGSKVNELQNLSADALSDRLKALNFFDVFTTRDAVVRLLEVVSINPSIKEQLLEYDEPGLEYLFLSEVFRTAVNAPDDHIVPLRPEDFDLIRSCREPDYRKPEDLSPAEPDDAPPDPVPEKAPPIRNIGVLPPSIKHGKTYLTESFLNYTAQWKEEENANPLEPLGNYEDSLSTRILTPSAYVTKEDLVDAFFSIMDSDEPILDPIDYADLTAIAWDSTPENICVLECMGREEEVLHYLTCQPRLSGTKGAAMISVLSPYASLEFPLHLASAVQESLGHDTMIFGTRLERDIIDDLACVWILLAR